MYTRSKGFVVASGVTGAFNVNRYLRSDFVRLTTVRIVHTTVDLIRAVAEKYLGEPNNAPQMNALSAEIDQVLLSMKSAGALNQYDFTVSSTPEQRVLGQCDVNLTLVPAFEITQINLTVSLADSI
jgi:phage tail sheath protein FI